MPFICMDYRCLVAHQHYPPPAEFSPQTFNSEVHAQRERERSVLPSDIWREMHLIPLSA